eukprot:TRINITY_DN101429_c0_g1_i2.p1 TRINITY_DN101429_c0_g1~~TRINITY_DN101429_c0_g1_i2.p1  ORF type:complete len:134 (-),score=28.21 TRINITY_DN101429_c0_g1_i2:9-377(-)
MNLTLAGPSTWPSKFPKAGGCRQSPVDISRKTAVYKNWPHDDGDTVLTIAYSAEQNLGLSNNGHTVKADCCQDESTVTGGPLASDAYRLAQFHLHWGAENDRGSEHTIDGKASAAEVSQSVS